MYCDLGADMGLMGLDLGAYEIEWFDFFLLSASSPSHFVPSFLCFFFFTFIYVLFPKNRLNMSIEYLPKCRFFWGSIIVIYDFELLMKHGGYLERLEGAGFRYSLTMEGFEVFILCFLFFYFLFLPAHPPQNVANDPFRVF